MSRWRYDFDCRDCDRVKEIGGERYCIPIREHRDCLTTGDDFVLRCSEYEPKQLCMEGFK